jgi:catechol 2,3-dioxygenase-like lactoylglutathione lyase family enzyme
MTHRGFPHIGLSTLDLDNTHAFYESMLGFKPVIDVSIRIGHLAHLFFDLDGGQLIALGQDGALQSAPTTRSLENSGSTSGFDTQTNGGIP